MSVDLIGSSAKSKSRYVQLLKTHREAPMQISIVKKLEDYEGEAKLELLGELEKEFIRYY